MSAGRGTLNGMTTTLDLGLAGQIRAALDDCRKPSTTPHHVAELTHAYAPTPSLLTPEQRLGRPEKSTSHLLYADHDFSMLAIVWRPGQQTRIHDHKCWCVVYVVQGTEHETQYVDHGDYLTETITVDNPVGSVSALVPPGDIHKIHNTSDRVAISLHIYGIDLRTAGSSARRFYTSPVRG